jgi:hypothetical protein
MSSEAVAALPGAVVGAFIGAAITFWFSLRLAEINAKRLAGMKLRAAFAPEIAKLTHPQDMTVRGSSNLLEQSFEKHLIAVNEFRFFLEGETLEGFDRAWREYYGGPADRRPNLIQYANVDAEQMEEALSRIEAILAFTKKR